MAQDGVKITQDGAEMAQDEAKMTQDRAKMAQDGPTRAKMEQNVVQDGTLDRKYLPRSPKGPPKEQNQKIASTSGDFIFTLCSQK